MKSPRLFFNFDWKKLEFRSFGFQLLFKELNKIKRLSPVIVETGCVRKTKGWDSDGSSSLLFHEAAQKLQAKFYTIDINPVHCLLAQKLCPHAHVLCGDSVTLLHELKRKIRRIDLLYLDSYDLDWNNPHPSALHHLMELCASMPLLKSGSLVFVDDNAHGKGKGMYVAEFLRKAGAQQVLDDYQIGFKIP